MRFSNRLVARLGLALGAVVLGLAAVTGEAGASVPASWQDLEMTAAFDKPSYRTGEPMRITVTVTNPSAGEVTAKAAFAGPLTDGIHVTSTNGFETGTPFTLAAGASVTHTITGAAGGTATTTATLHGFLSAAEESYPNKRFSFSTPVTPTSGHVTGVVFHDRNDNGRPDSGEGVGGVSLWWDNQLQYADELYVTTNAAGEFAADLPAGPYRVSGTASGLMVTTREVTVTESGVDDVLFRAMSPLVDLAVKAEFTKDSYGRTEAPTVRMTLTNNGDVRLTRIITRCDPRYNDIGLTGADWGDLSGAGVTIEAHSTKVLEVTEAMPVRTFDHGYVTVDCDFGYEGMTDASNPRAYDSAAVPGRMVEVTGRVMGNGYGLAGVPMVLTAASGCPIAGRTTTDQDGRFTFGSVQAGEYAVYAFPEGWTFKAGNNIRSVSAVYGQPAVVEFTPWPGSTWPHTQPPKCPAPGGPWS